MEELSKDTPETVSVVDIQFRPGQRSTSLTLPGLTWPRGTM